MDDLISRQKALALAKDLVTPYPDGAEYRHRCIDATEIKLLPSEKPMRWIPVSERLPELFKEVLVTTSWGGVTKAQYFWRDYWVIKDGYITSAMDKNVVAWMPLPPAYQGE